MQNRVTAVAALWARLVLGATFLESVLDRFGVLAARGTEDETEGDRP